MTLEIKIILGVVLILALLGGGYFGYRSAYDSGQTAGKAQIQTAWDNDKAAITATADAAIAAATKAKEDALANNEAISNDYQAQLSAANASASQFAQRLRNAEATIAANRSAMSKAGSGSSLKDPGAPTSSDQLGQLVALVTDLRTECAANADQLDALNKELAPQL